MRDTGVRYHGSNICLDKILKLKKPKIFSILAYIYIKHKRGITANQFNSGWRPI